MCEWGTTEPYEVTVPAHLSHSGHDYRRVVAIDACILPIVKALNEGGVPTAASCCGHGGRGSVALHDGRELLIAPDHEEGLERAYAVAKRKLGTRRSETVKEIIAAYSGEAVLSVKATEELDTSATAAQKEEL